MCGAFERKENDFWELKNIIYTYDTSIQNGQIHQWNLNIKVYMIYFLKHSPKLIYARRKINSNCKYLALLH